MTKNVNNIFTYMLSFYSLELVMWCICRAMYALMTLQTVVADQWANDDADDDVNDSHVDACHRAAKSSSLSVSTPSRSSPVVIRCATTVTSGVAVRLTSSSGTSAHWWRHSYQRHSRLGRWQQPAVCSRHIAKDIQVRLKQSVSVDLYCALHTPRRLTARNVTLCLAYTRKKREHC